MKPIDKDALLKTINQNPASNHAQRCVQLLDAILCAPPIDVIEVIHAKWILQESPYAEHEEVYDGESHDRYVCSHCGHEAVYMYDLDGFEDGQDLTPWCGECGAQMEGDPHD